MNLIYGILSGIGGGIVWRVVFYEKEDGRVPVEEFLRAIDSKARAKTVREIGLLREFGTELREPYSKFLQDGIFELRIRFSSDSFRVFYFFCRGRTIVLTNAFIKKTNKTPPGELRQALLSKADFERRSSNA